MSIYEECWELQFSNIEGQYYLPGNSSCGSGYSATQLAALDLKHGGYFMVFNVFPFCPITGVLGLMSFQLPAY